MKITLVCSQYQLLFFSFLFITSCYGQEKTNLSEKTAIPIPPPTLFTENQKSEDPWIDPLFFIEGQLCQHLRKMHQDKKGNLWFGTNVYDLMRYDGDTLVYFSEKDGVGKGRITDILEDKKGNIWFGTYSGLTKFDGQSFTNYSEEDGLVNSEIWSMAVDKNGLFWIGTMEGVYKFDGKEFTSFPIPKAEVEHPDPILAPNRITSILEDNDGNIWFGTDGYGITIYDGNTFSHFTKKNGLCDNNVYGFMQDKNGNIWIGTMFGGVSKYDGKSFINYTMDGVIKGDEVGAFYEDKRGNIWFAAENFGVYRYDGKSFTNLYKEAGLITNGILCILEDRENRFWFGGWGGLFRFDGNTFFPVTKDGPWDK